MTVDNAGLRRMTRFGAVHYGQPVVERIIEAAQELASQTGAREFTAKLGDIEWGALMDQAQTNDLRRAQPGTLIVAASAGPVTCSRDDTCEGISVQPIGGGLAAGCGAAINASSFKDVFAKDVATCTPELARAKMKAPHRIHCDVYRVHCCSCGVDPSATSLTTALLEGAGRSSSEQLIAELQRRHPDHAAMLDVLSGDELRAELRRRGGPGRDDWINFATDEQLHAECRRRGHIVGQSAPSLEAERDEGVRLRNAAEARWESASARCIELERERDDWKQQAQAALVSANNCATARDEWRRRAELAETKVAMADAAKASARRERDEIQADFKKLAELKSPMPRHLLEAEMFGPDGTLRLARERAEEAERFRDSQGAKIDSMRASLAAVREELRVAKLDLELAGGSSYAIRPRESALCDPATAVGCAGACHCAPTCEKFKCWCSCGWSCTGFPTVDEARDAVGQHLDAAVAGVQTPSAPQVDVMQVDVMQAKLGEMLAAAPQVSCGFESLVARVKAENGGRIPTAEESMRKMMLSTERGPGITEKAIELHRDRTGVVDMATLADLLCDDEEPRR